MEHRLLYCNVVLDYFEGETSSFYPSIHKRLYHIFGKRKGPFLRVCLWGGQGLNMGRNKYSGPFYPKIVSIKNGSQMEKEKRLS